MFCEDAIELIHEIVNTFAKKYLMAPPEKKEIWFFSLRMFEDLGKENLMQQVKFKNVSKR